MSKHILVTAAAASGILLTLSACKNTPQDSPDITSAIMSPDGTKLGTVELQSLGSKGVKVHVTVSGISPGTHAMHFHEIGKCIAPDFKSSGGHYNPHGKAHGINMADGPHAGDMMNVVASSDGKGIFSVINDRVSINGEHGLPALLDADGTALVLHAGADDYESQPSGAAGARIGCAVIGG